MNDDEITALAREYAERDEPFVQIVQDDAEMFLRWLCNRYCLVDKSEVERLYQLSKERFEGYHILTAEIALETIETLFPRIRKEEE